MQIHADIEIFDEHRYGSPGPLRYSYGLMFGSFVAVMTMFAAIYLYFEDKHMFRPVKPPQLAQPGVVHYTFERKS